MNLDLTDEEAASLAALLRWVILDYRCPLSPRVKTWQAILDKVAPRPVREPPPPLPKPYVPPRASAATRRNTRR
jgi:hypothetical protein